MAVTLLWKFVVPFSPFGSLSCYMSAFLLECAWGVSYMCSFQLADNKQQAICKLLLPQSSIDPFHIYHYPKKKKHKNFWSWIGKGIDIHKSTQKPRLFKCFSSLSLEQQDTKSKHSWAGRMYCAGQTRTTINVHMFCFLPTWLGRVSNPHAALITSHMLLKQSPFVTQCGEGQMPRLHLLNKDWHVTGCRR